MYNLINESDLAALRAIVGDERVLYGEEINEDYSHDELGGISRMPDVLVRVRSTEEIAAMTGVPAATVRTRLHRAREKLRNLLGGFDDA